LERIAASVPGIKRDIPHLPNLHNLVQAGAEFGKKGILQSLELMILYDFPGILPAHVKSDWTVSDPT
jgi:hypothetical protein